MVASGALSNLLFSPHLLDNIVYFLFVNLLFISMVIEISTLFTAF